MSGTIPTNAGGTLPRVVITGVGLTSPNGNDLASFRKNLLNKVSGVRPWEIRHVGATLAGVCDFDALQARLRCGTSCGSCVPEIRRMLAEGS